MKPGQTLDPESLKAAGWRSYDGRGFTAQLGPCWINGSADGRMLGFVVADSHTNEANLLHGGALLTFADICLGYKAWESANKSLMVTAQLQMHFVSSAKPGDFVVGRPEIIRQTRQLIFTRGLFSVGDRTIASADGIWKIREPA